VVISVIVFVDGLLTGSLMLQISAWRPAWRILFAGIFMAATGFMLGIPFPAVLRFIHQRGKGRGNVPWAWSINGGATVVGSALAAMTALEIGIQDIFAVAAVCYAAAGLCAAVIPPLSRSWGQTSPL